MSLALLFSLFFYHFFLLSLHRLYWSSDTKVTVSLSGFLLMCHSYIRPLIYLLYWTAVFYLFGLEGDPPLHRH